MIKSGLKVTVGIFLGVLLIITSVGFIILGSVGIVIDTDNVNNAIIEILNDSIDEGVENNLDSKTLTELYQKSLERCGFLNGTLNELDGLEINCSMITSGNIEGFKESYKNELKVAVAKKIDIAEIENKISLIRTGSIIMGIASILFVISILFILGTMGIVIIGVANVIGGMLLFGVGIIKARAAFIIQGTFSNSLGLVKIPNALEILIERFAEVIYSGLLIQLVLGVILVIVGIISVILITYRKIKNKRKLK
ncbi:hypothetical protein COU60_04190 [Candidatus Pacearchaeota archaeon CG10_big_fil_rev_8_21_14_0_10_34_76]|nr:MAG: hypothetical protein COU60_04190 [Candidatus Pacearchaeota archaeon CG10_big_fil_rev_8_21_14_0_10_34_76]